MPGLPAQNRAVSQVFRDRLGLERRRLHDQNQIGPNGLLHLAQQGNRYIGKQGSFVKLIQQYSPDTFEKRIIQQLPGQNPFG